MFVITSGQQKGGVGKTTVTANVAAICGELGYRTLAVDLDPQSHLTFSLGQQAPPGRSLGELLNRNVVPPVTFDDIVMKNVLPNVDLLPGSEAALVRAEHDIDGDRIGGLTRLRDVLNAVGDQYDLCWIDTPPKVEGLSVVAMVASEGVVIVAEPQTLSYNSTTVYAAKVAEVAAQPGLNPKLRVLGVLLNKAGDGEEATMIREMLAESDLYLFETTIPASKLASKAAAGGVPAALANRNHGIGQIYRDVADEIADRIQETRSEAAV